MVRDDGTVVLIDFDQSKQKDEPGYYDALENERDKMKAIDNNIATFDNNKEDVRNARKRKLYKIRQAKQHKIKKKDDPISKKLF